MDFAFRVLFTIDGEVYVYHVTAQTRKKAIAVAKYMAGKDGLKVFEAKIETEAG